MMSKPQSPDERINGDVKETMLSSVVAMVTCHYYITSFTASCRGGPHGQEENMSHCPLFLPSPFFFYPSVCVRGFLLVVSGGDSCSIRKVGPGWVSGRHSALPQWHTWIALYACCLCVCTWDQITSVSKVVLSVTPLEVFNNILCYIFVGVATLHVFLSLGGTIALRVIVDAWIIDTCGFIYLFFCQ